MRHPIRPIHSRQASGFSLIELLITLVILGILSAMTGPSILGLLRDARLSSQADLLVSTLNSARMDAIKQRKDFTVCPASSNVNTDTACSANVAHWVNGVMIWNGANIVQRSQPNQGLTITTTATSVVFNGTFGSAVAASSFTLCVPGRKEQQIDVYLSGRVSKKINATTCS